MGLLWSYLYVGTVVVVGEVSRRMGLSKELARKIIHVGVGLWIFGTLALFENRWMAIIPPLTSALGNYFIHRRKLLQSTEADEDNLGTVWFPIAFAILIAVAWETPRAVAGGVMAMTIGDALAASVGIRIGRHKYETLGGAVKSLEGSLGMLLGTFAAVWLTIGATAPMAAIAALTAVVGMVTEAYGIKGRDNIWVPLSAGATIYLGLQLSPDVVNAVGIGAVLAAVIGIAAWLKGSLSPSGVLGAILTGTLLFGLSGWTGGLALIAFFISSSVLTRLFKSRKADFEADYAKTGQRDLGQALANGGVAAAGALLLGVTGNEAFLGALIGALAAANADTWATELGVLDRRGPRLVTSFQPVPAGTSGGVSLVGTLAALGGSALVAVVAAATHLPLLPAVPMLVLAGLAGSFADSLLGATVQGVYWCRTCSKETERRVHRCGEVTALHRGLPWLGNDMVNLIATLVGALIGYLAV